MKHGIKGLMLLTMVVLYGCGGDSIEPDSVSLISSTVNGVQLGSNPEEIAIESTVILDFNASLDPVKFAAALSYTDASGSPVNFDIQYANAQTKVILESTLDYGSSYSIQVTTAAIGKNGGSLKSPFSASFSTIEDGTVYSMAPCTGTTACLGSQTLDVSGIPATFDVYSNYPIYLENASWEKLKYAVIVIHGQNRNADDYFSYLTSTLGDIGKEESTVLLSPVFKDSPDTQDDLYWSSNSGWREGRLSNSEGRLSSFAVVDSLIAQLNNRERFPVLEKIIITGHSSGGLFTHVYAGSNHSENKYQDTAFEYIVANSQYFYYPSDHRLNEDTGQFYEPTGCTGFNFWPMGFTNHPGYVDMTASDYNDQFKNRNITYLLGNGTGPDGTLNTTNCNATLLGSTRYLRGENMFEYMNTFYNNENAHQRTIVEGVGHDGEGMYTSPEFSDLLKNTLN